MTIVHPFVGLCGMIVCSDGTPTDEEILSFCNTNNPSGTHNGWGEVVREGEDAPIVCDTNAERRHYLVYC